MKRIGFVEVHKKLFGNTQAEENYIESVYFDVNHSFWANHIRLTPLGKAIADEVNKLDYRQPISWHKLIPEINKQLNI